MKIGATLIRGLNVLMVRPVKPDRSPCCCELAKDDASVPCGGVVWSWSRHPCTLHPALNPSQCALLACTPLPRRRLPHTHILTDEVPLELQAWKWLSRTSTFWTEDTTLMGRKGKRRPNRSKARPGARKTEEKADTSRSARWSHRELGSLHDCSAVPQSRHRDCGPAKTRPRAP